MPQSTYPPKRRRSWTPDGLWEALLSDDKKALAVTHGCSPANVYARTRKFRTTSPGGSGLHQFADREIHPQMSRMLQAARHEVLAAVAFVSADPPPVFEQLLGAARRRVAVRLIFRSDNITGPLVQSMQEAGVAFRTLSDLHAKILITDTTAMNGSANLTEASAHRASEVATFFSKPRSVYELRTIFGRYWARARPFDYHKTERRPQPRKRRLGLIDHQSQ